MLSGPYQAGSTIEAARIAPVWLRYSIVHSRTDCFAMLRSKSGAVAAGPAGAGAAELVEAPSPKRAETEIDEAGDAKAAAS